MAETSSSLGTDDAAPPPDHTVLKAVVIGLGVLIILALIALVAGAIWKLGGSQAPASAAGPYETSVAVAPGESLAGMTGAGDRLYLHVTGTQGPRIIVVDSLTGRVLGTVRLAPAP